MRIIRSLHEMISHAEELQKNGIRIGLVPTMGYLHEGHLSLVRLLDGHCDLKAASIFVNPIQFGPNEDLAKYPRNEVRDLELLEKEGCELVFAPSPEEMYPEDYQTYIEVELMSKTLCGRFRPDHFRGVATIVNRLFNLTRCSVAAFGLKDFQQAQVIKKMKRDLHLPVKLLFGETVREDDGLAMSSRNAYLDEEQRNLAGYIPKSLEWVSREANVAEQDSDCLRAGMEDILNTQPGIKIQYIEFVDPKTLDPVQIIDRKVQVLLAVYIGKTRLIDNIEIGPGSKMKPFKELTV
ncbi:MAG: pantoate--beta-alanine ligase [Calditrichaeota bacterium]|nr:pantoate--beta-alanine ligase [Calditrichota bacterium]MBT7618183.1 pantoate--beta-alanine ligase [Calditrichota bacterium]MBT7788634.1 pantoate--beta-alanine ligase [Calditrichota bacterium]